MNLDLFIDGKSVNAKLKQTQKVSVTTRELEDIIESFSVPTKIDDSILDIVICSRYDCHLLDCRRPLVPINSTLGIIEESILDEKQIELIGSFNPTVNVTLVEGLPSSTSSAGGDATKNTSDSVPEPPHSQWKRSPAVVPSVDHTTVNNAIWVDLLNTNDVQLSTPADCCHFVRSLLGSSHDASPWGDSGCESPTLVAAILPHTAETLESFRTTDAAPSYFLHSISRLQIPAHNPQWWMQQRSVPGGDEERISATLLVYRKLPPRDSFLLEHPEANLNPSLPDGCLWESYFRQDDEEDDDAAVNGGTIQMKEFWRQVAPPYVNCAQDYPKLIEALMEHLPIIREEALSIPQWTAWPEKNHYSSNPNNPDAPTWTVFPLCHCFPANLVENRKWIDATCNFVPRTTEIIRTILGDTLRTALFSRLDPETTLEAHTGWEDLANHVYRLHLPLLVPPGGLCGTWVDGAVETHEEGRALCFDDSKVHRAFNYSQRERIVLILDLARPQGLPLGTASGGHTEELDNFINSVKK